MKGFATQIPGDPCSIQRGWARAGRRSKAFRSYDPIRTGNYNCHTSEGGI